MKTEREKFEETYIKLFDEFPKCLHFEDGFYNLIEVTKGHAIFANMRMVVNASWIMWQAAKAEAVPTQFNVNSILRDIDFYFDNGLSNTERTACNLLQSIYEKLSNEAKAMIEAQEQSE